MNAFRLDLIIEGLVKLQKMAVSHSLWHCTVTPKAAHLRYFQRIEKIVSWYYIKRLDKHRIMCSFWGNSQLLYAFLTTPLCTHEVRYWLLTVIRRWKYFSKRSENWSRSWRYWSRINCNHWFNNWLKFIEIHWNSLNLNKLMIPAVLHYLVTNIVVDEYNTSFSP